MVKKKIKDLKPAEYNPRIDVRNNKEFYNKLKKSIDSFGYVTPVIYNKKTGNLVGGHQRIAVLEDMGYKEIDAVEVDLSIDEEKSLNIALNKITGDWDMNKLASVIDSITDDDLKYVTGFDEQEIDKLMVDAGLVDINDEKTDVAALIEKEAKYKPERGDLFQLGDHLLLCGDSCDSGAVSGLFRKAGKKADMVFTDPPYNVDYGASKNPRHKIRKIKNDKQLPKEWEEFNKKWIENFINNYKGGDVYVWGASGYDGMRQRLLFEKYKFKWSATIIWKKQQLVLSPAKYQRMYECCFYGWRTKSTYDGGRKQTEVWEMNRPLDSKLHPTMKPLEICVKAIENSSKPNNIVLDMFGGSGSTLIACERTGRRCFMIEIDPHYCSVIIERWEEYTGQNHKKIKGGEK